LLPQMAGQTPEKVYFYGAGCSTPKKVKEVSDALQMAFPTAEIQVEHDLLAAARGLCGTEPGLPCILGTGCNSAVYDGEKITANVPSLGFWLGDEGSGGFLGRQLLIYFLNKELPAELQDEFAKTFPEVNYSEVMERVYRKPYPNRYMASFATFIAPRNKHPFIQQLLRDGFQLFFNRQLGTYPEHKSLPAHFVGSIAYYNSDILKEVAAKNQIIIGRILRGPMEGLIQYHLQLLNG
jgi:glucosamine kinase